MGRATCNLSDGIDEYLGFLTARQLAKNTVKNTKYLLKRALALWGNIHMTNLQQRHVNQLFAEARWAPRTHNTNLQILRQFFQWARNQGYMPMNNDPAFGWRNMRVPKHDKLRLPVEQFMDLLDAAEHPRDRAQIAAGLFLFVRGSELVTIRIGDVDFSRSEVAIWRHKTKEADVLPMCDELQTELVTYLNWYRADQGDLHEQWRLFPAKDKASLRWSGVKGQYRTMAPPTEPARLAPMNEQSHPYRAAQYALAKLGFPTYWEGEHTLRRSGARAYADSLRSQGYDGALLRVASMLGHKDTKQTEHYIGWELERQQRNADLAGKPMFGDRLTRHETLRLVKE